MMIKNEIKAHGHQVSTGNTSSHSVTDTAFVVLSRICYLVKSWKAHFVIDYHLL